jgi:hypothetical protein
MTDNHTAPSLTQVTKEAVTDMMRLTQEYGDFKAILPFDWNENDVQEALDAAPDGDLDAATVRDAAQYGAHFPFLAGIVVGARLMAEVRNDD